MGYLALVLFGLTSRDPALAVVLLVAQGFVINRPAGLDYPLWAPPRSSDPRRAP